MEGDAENLMFLKLQMKVFYIVLFDVKIELSVTCFMAMQTKMFLLQKYDVAKK